MNFIPQSLKIPLILLAGIMIIAGVSLTFRTGDNRLQDADKTYHGGESASTLSERKQAFNHALDLFLQLDNEYQPNFGNGKLSYNIGNTYFQLGEYPLAAFYYKKAKKLMPRSEVIERSLSQTEQKLGLTPKKTSDLFSSFLLNPWLSLPERLQGFFVTALMMLILASAWIWNKIRWLLYLTIIAIIPFSFLLLNLTLTYYFAPIEAVVIHATELRRDAGTEYATVTPKPIQGGTTVEVLGGSSNGQWLKVITPEGVLGYMPASAARVL